VTLSLLRHSSRCEGWTRDNVIQLFGHLALFTAVLGFASLTEASDLPNDCAIVATEANARLATSAIWSQVLLVRFIDIKNVQINGHALVVWQIHKDGSILVYDESGTVDLDTRSQNPNDIAAALNKRNPLQPIYAAHFIQ
jgi:hypothetical protein